MSKQDLRQFCSINDKWNSVAYTQLKLKSHEFNKETYTLKVFFN